MRRLWVFGLLIALWGMHGLPMIPMSAAAMPMSHSRPTLVEPTTVAMTVHETTNTAARPVDAGCDAGHDHCDVRLRPAPNPAASAVCAIADRGPDGTRSDPFTTTTRPPRAPPDPARLDKLCVSRT